MSTYTIEVEADLTFEADPDDLRERFPVEYAEFVELSRAHGTEATDKGWLAECFHQNPDLFVLVDRTDEVTHIDPKVVKSRVTL